MKLEFIENSGSLLWASKETILNHALECHDEIDRLKESLKLIASYDKDSKYGEGICPYGCDCPNIARNALDNPE